MGGYGAGIKKMRGLAILAIIVVLILHIVSWIPVIKESNEVRERKSNHKDGYSYYGYGYHNEDHCDDCEGYNETIDRYNQEGAMLWQTTITYCVLIGIGGAVAYGVGTLVELKQIERYRKKED